MRCRAHPRLATGIHRSKQRNPGIALLFPFSAAARSAGVQRLDDWLVNIRDLRSGADVVMAGITIRRMEAVRLDKDFLGAVSRWINQRYRQMQAHGTARVLTPRILGGLYLKIWAGDSQVDLGNPNRMQHTRQAFVVDGAINQLMATVSPP